MSINRKFPSYKKTEVLVLNSNGDIEYEKCFCRGNSRNGKIHVGK